MTFCSCSLSNAFRKKHSIEKADRHGWSLFFLLFYSPSPSVEKVICLSTQQEICKSNIQNKGVEKFWYRGLGKMLPCLLDILYFRGRLGVDFSCVAGGSLSQLCVNVNNQNLTLMAEAVCPQSPLCGPTSPM